MENITRIQLLDSEAKGYLDVKEGTVLPLNFAVSDIRDVSSRDGMFSKTVQLSGSKNNNLILNNYFEVNITDGSFDVNKLQRVAVIQNGIIIRDNCYLRLLKVVKTQTVDTNIDELVEYEAQVTDEIGNFFKGVGNKEVKALNGWNTFDHIYGNSAVVASFDNTVVDGYKYALPWIDNYNYALTELLPAVYAKQIFDRIHEQAGFSYDWASMTDDDIQFDKAIIPYSGDKKKLTEDYLNSVRVVAKNSSTFTSGLSILGNGLSNGYIASQTIPMTDEISDPESYYDAPNSKYNNVFSVIAPNSLTYKLKLEYKLIFVNDDSRPIYLAGAQQRFTVPRRIFDLNGGVSLEGSNLPLIINPTYAPTLGYYSAGSDRTVRILHTTGYNWAIGEHPVATGSEELYIPLTNLSGIEQIVSQIGVTMQNSLGSQWRQQTTSAPANMKMKIEVSVASIEIAPSADSGMLPGSTIKLQEFLPAKIKQSEFLKSVYQKYNLYVEPDPNNPNRLIYTPRNEFYDGGVIHDLTKKLDKSKPQELLFLPDITSKTLSLKHKDDSSDPALTAYLGEVGLTFGQVRYTFKNENVKGDAVNEESFSPTMNVPTEFGAVLPLLSADFKMNVRFLQDGGALPCAPYTITESTSQVASLTTYPHLSMFNRPYNPTFSNEYAMSDFYLYDVGTPTQNTLYNRHWRRTFAQIDSGKMFKAYFWLDEAFIRKVKMSDKIKVNNVLYYINAIVDYDANSYSPTKMELLTVEDDLTLPRIGRDVKEGTSVPDVIGTIGNNPFNPTKPSLPGGFLPAVIGSFTPIRDRATAVYSGVIDTRGVFGTGAILTKGFKGIVIGDGIATDGDGVYVGDTTKIGKDEIRTPIVESPIVKNGGNIIDLSNPTGIVFDSPTVDFGGATIINSPTVVGVYDAGTGANSIKSLNPSTTQASGDYSLASGYDTSATGFGGVSLGGSNNANGDYATAIGKANTAESYAIAMGENNTASNFFSTAIGSLNNVSGGRSVGIGDTNTVGGAFSVALGRNILNNATESISIGGYNETYSNQSYILGRGSYVNSGCSGAVVLGRGITGNVADTTFVDRLNIKNITAGTIVNNLGYDATGKVIIGTMAGGSTTLVVYNTYAGVASLKSSNSLVPGTKYYITDRDIIVTAVKADAFELEATRVFNVIISSQYTPNTIVIGPITTKRLGIYGQGIPAGSTPVDVPLSLIQTCIWGGSVWSRNTSGADVQGSSMETLQSGWTKIPRTDLTYYEPKMFNIIYNFDSDYIFSQTDNKGNTILASSNTASLIDNTDWGAPGLFNNRCYGIYNNYKLDGSTIFIYSNTNWGNIVWNRGNNLSVYYNTNTGNIEKNSVSLELSRNDNNGNISNNSMTDGCFKNNNAGSIEYNLFTDYVSFNTNSGDISGNDMGRCTLNRNNGGIFRNIKTTGGIGIISNNNNGNIGNPGSNTSRSSTIQDTVVNK